MIRLDISETKFIKEAIENGEQLIKDDDFEALLLALDSWITANGFDKNYNLTDKGRKIQKMYDNIFYNN